MSGERYALPCAFVDGLAFLRPLLKSKGDRYETEVNLLGGKLYVLTTQLVVEFDAGSLGLRDWWFAPELIQIMEAFKASPVEVFDHDGNLCFRWEDGQEFVAHLLHPLRPGSTYQRMADQAFGYFRPFDHGIAITDETRRYLRKHVGDKKLASDVFIDGQSVASWMSSDGKSKTSECLDPFPVNSTRVMRFDRQAFLNMIRVADEIDFSVSPVCFRHGHGRGLLIERTATSDTPNFGVSDD